MTLYFVVPLTLPVRISSLFRISSLYRASLGFTGIVSTSVLSFAISCSNELHVDEETEKSDNCLLVSSVS